MQGVFRCLKTIDHLSLAPKEAEHWCDNRQAVIDCEIPQKLKKNIVCELMPISY